MTAYLEKFIEISQECDLYTAKTKTQFLGAALNKFFTKYGYWELFKQANWLRGGKGLMLLKDCIKLERASNTSCVLSVAEILLTKLGGQIPYVGPALSLSGKLIGGAGAIYQYAMFGSYFFPVTGMLVGGLIGAGIYSVSWFLSAC